MIKVIHIGRLILIFLGALSASCLYAWNGMGHQLVAALAYQHLTPAVKKQVNAYNHELDSVLPSYSFTRAATWMDALRGQGISWFDSLHYIDLPFSEDGTPLPKVSETNQAVWAVNQARKTLRDPHSSSLAKALSLRLLLHVVGDLHQPLHAASRYSWDLPQGDKGGNLFNLGYNPVSTRLHGYWDNGAGLLMSSRRDFRGQFHRQLHVLARSKTCSGKYHDLDPEHWALESHQLAVNYAYRIKPYAKPNLAYQQQAQKIVKKQITLAACRLAALLNQNLG